MAKVGAKPRVLSLLLWCNGAWYEVFFTESVNAEESDNETPDNNTEELYWPVDDNKFSRKTVN